MGVVVLVFVVAGASDGAAGQAVVVTVDRCLPALPGFGIKNTKTTS